MTHRLRPNVLEVELLIWKDFSKAMLPEKSDQGICRQQWVSMVVESVEEEKKKKELYAWSDNRF